MSELQRDIDARRTFAIISHPDAGKTTMTEKLLLLGQAIQVAGSVKGKRGPHATSDWMALEQERGISVTSSVMQFPYKERWVNLLDTPGHEDFSEDTYLPDADGGRFGAYGDRWCQGRRGPHHQADECLPSARYAHHDLRQQARS